MTSSESSDDMPSIGEERVVYIDETGIGGVPVASAPPIDIHVPGSTKGSEEKINITDINSSFAMAEVVEEYDSSSESTTESVTTDQPEADPPDVAVPRETPDEPATPSQLRDPAFSSKVKEVYEYSCAICGKERWSPQGASEVEAAHIYPVAGSDQDVDDEGGPDVVENGLALCRLHHWAFDNGWFAIDDDYTIIVRDEPDVTGYNEFIQFQGQKLHLPEKEEFWPEERYLQAHRSLSTSPDNE